MKFRSISSFTFFSPKRYVLNIYCMSNTGQDFGDKIIKILIIHSLIGFPKESNNNVAVIR